MAMEYPMDSVDERELQSALVNQLRDWRTSGTSLERTFEFPDFQAALGFVNAVGEKAEMIGHHPDIDIRYNKVKLSLTSHDAGGITRRDLVLAGYINEVAPQYETRKTA
jgi:4a-hydroxytetrahydrobiopterin dehydratase